VRPSKRPSGFFSLEGGAAGGNVEFALPADVDRDLVHTSARGTGGAAAHKYAFDGHFGMDVRQEDVFDAVARDVDEVVFDGEMMAWDSALGEFLPFGHADSAALSLEKDPASTLQLRPRRFRRQPLRRPSLRQRRCPPAPPSCWRPRTTPRLCASVC
jgi:hypothetical protein